MARAATANGGGVSPRDGENSQRQEALVRVGGLADLNELLALEARFPGDRLSGRQFRRHLRSSSAWLGVAEADGRVAGYALLFFRHGARRARLYSITVDPGVRGRGLGKRLLEAAEAAAQMRCATTLSLEVRTDNSVAIQLYERAGFQRFGRYAGYYEDGADAWRFEKALH